MEYSVILFHSTQYAIWTAKLLKQSGIDHKMIPVPRRLSSDCGYCVRIKKENRAEIEALLKSTGIDYDRIEAL
jgi:hypothetical protein